MGEAVWDVYISRVLVLSFEKQQKFKLNANAARSTRFKAYALRVLLDGFDFTAEEQNMIRWALTSRLYPGKIKYKKSERNVRQATAMEALVGFLYLKEPERLHRVLQELGLEDYDVMLDTAQQLSGP